MYSIGLHSNKIPNLCFLYFSIVFCLPGDHFGGAKPFLTFCLSTRIDTWTPNNLTIESSECKKDRNWPQQTTVNSNKNIIKRSKIMEFGINDKQFKVQTT